MRTGSTLCWALLCVAVAAGEAGAATTGSFTYQVPAGWQECAGPAGFDVSYCTQGGALIAVKSPVPGSDAAAIARSGLQGAEILQDTAVPFAGQPGHLVITRMQKSPAETFLVAAAATAAGGGVKVALVAKAEMAREAVQLWGDLIDKGSFAAADAPARPTRPFKVHNVAADCEAKVTIDGQELSVPAGQTREIQLSEGPHEFHWSERDGSAQGVSASVPPAETLNAACTPGAAPGPGPGPAPPTLPHDASGSFGDVADGARAAVSFYRTCWNLVFQQDLLEPVPRSVDRMMLKVVVRRDRSRWRDFLDFPGYKRDLDAAIQRTASDATARGELRRLAYFALLRAGQVGVPTECDPGGTSLDQNALTCSADAFVKHFSAGGQESLITAAGMSLRFPRIGSADNPADIIGMIRKVGQ